MTRVEECTRAEIGVGADMARGNQEENGKIADLVEKAKNKSTTEEVGITEELNHELVGMSITAFAISKRNRASPKRFINTVKRPE